MNIWKNLRFFLKFWRIFEEYNDCSRISNFGECLKNSPKHEEYKEYVEYMTILNNMKIFEEYFISFHLFQQKKN
jgi:hypothetical protein